MTTHTAHPDKSNGSPLGSESSYRQLVNCITDYAIIMIDFQGKVVTWNPGAEKIKGYRADEIVGKDFSCFYTPEDLAQGLPAKEMKIAAEQSRYEDEGWRVRKDGSRFWASVVISALRDGNGVLQGFAKITRDITDRKRSEELIRQQSLEILELSTPVVQVWQGVVAAPLIGVLDSQRTQQFMERLLNRIVETNSPVALVDITGVPTIDTQTAQHLIETITAVRLLGAQVVLTGVRPAIAQTLVHLGINLAGIVTRSSLAGGLAVALELLDLQVVKKSSRQTTG